MVLHTNNKQTNFKKKGFPVLSNIKGKEFNTQTSPRINKIITFCVWGEGVSELIIGYKTHNHACIIFAFIVHCVEPHKFIMVPGYRKVTLTELWKGSLLRNKMQQVKFHCKEQLKHLIRSLLLRNNCTCLSLLMQRCCRYNKEENQPWNLHFKFCINKDNYSSVIRHNVLIILAVLLLITKVDWKHVLESQIGLKR